MGLSSITKSADGTGRSTTPLGLVIRLLIVLAVDLMGGWLAVNLFVNGAIPFAVVITLVALIASVILLRSSLYPMRWMVIGIALLLLFSIYPIVFTIFIAFTNYGDGHLLTKDQAIAVFEDQRYLPEGGAAFSWAAFRSEAGKFALWLLPPDGGPGLLAEEEIAVRAVTPGTEGVGELDADGIPVSIAGYPTRLNRLTVLQYLNVLDKVPFGSEDDRVRVRSLEEAAQVLPKYIYNAADDTLVDQETGQVFNNVDGTFVGSSTGEQLRPGFRATVGLENFLRFFTSAALRGPLVRIITWNFAFAFLSVFLTFALGLTIAYIYNDPEFPGRRTLRSFLLIPYTVPSLITILIWKGLLNQDFGIINRMLGQFLDSTPPWTTNQWWAKVAVLLVNLWLGYPYFMLICSGALQAIPADLYQAAEIDGANGWQRFSRITLPLLLVAVGPLLMASFTFNFNNFNLIFLFIGGGPPISGASTRAGHTDILISYVYNLAFAGGRGFDYGLASAITIVIFIIVAAITLFQFRYTRMWEEVSENV